MNVSFILIFVLLIQLILTVSTNLNQCDKKYFIVVDAGSSGTRFHLFTFLRIGGYPVLSETRKLKSVSALSKFSNYRADWTVLRQMFSAKIHQVSKLIDKNCKNSTEFYVKATAGLRQIDKAISNRILNHVKMIVKKSEFRYQSDSVSIITSADEGRLAWISVNFLLDNFQKNSTTMGSMDLGGGSTQIAFETFRPELANFTKTIKIFGRNYSIYCGAYSYQGVNVIRMKYLNTSKCSNENCNDIVLRSRCISTSVNRKFSYGGLKVKVGGSYIEKNKRTCHCYFKALEYIKKIREIRKYLPEKAPFLGMSAFYFVLKSAKVLEKVDDYVYKTTILKIISETFKACDKPPDIPKERFIHFLCMDLSYILALLHNGYKIEVNEVIYIANKINGTHLSWALGFAISKL